jgi:hypothetical protein
MDPSIINKLNNWDYIPFTQKECEQAELYQIGRTILELLLHVKRNYLKKLRKNTEKKQKKE